jgi:FkbH-like protein
MAIPGFIEDLGCLQNLKILDEDRKRGDYYLAERQRKDFEKSFETMDEYLSRLGMELTIESLEEANVPRVSQLTLKTNQFNLTTRRYQESDIREFLKAGAKIYTLRMKDVFGDYGLVGVAILTPRGGTTWMFDTFLLSCRVLGRSVETAFTGYCLDELKRAGCRVAVGEYVRSAKNDQVRDFYARMNFVPGEGNDESRIFTFDLVEGGRVSTPAFFTLHARGSGE